MMLANYQKRCQSIDEITKGQEEWKLKYFDLQKEIQKLSEDNKQLKEEKENCSKNYQDLMKTYVKKVEDSKTNADKLEKIKELHFHAGCMGDTQCHNCKVLKELK